MKYGTVCTGIGCPSMAWVPLGWEPQWFSEIKPFPCAVLQHHYPHVPNLGDMLKIHQHEKFKESNIDVLFGGTPCQSFSVAGLRKGLDDPRGNLALSFLSILDRKRPRWVGWENVPGVLSSWTNETASDGVRWQTNDFDTFTRGLSELGYGVAWRILNAQYFGVPQRRRRVFVIGYLGDWRRAAAVLFERQSMSGNIAPSRSAGQTASRAIAVRAGNSSANGKEWSEEHFPTLTKDTHYIMPENANPLLGTHNLKHDHTRDTIVFPSIDGVNSNNFTASAGKKHVNNQTPLIFQQNHRNEVRYTGGDGQTAGSLGADVGVKQQNYLHQNQMVRRLMPVECERLQGIPDNYTRIAWNGKPPEKCPDSHRYEAIGNGIAVPVLEWLARRIEMVDKL